MTNPSKRYKNIMCNELNFSMGNYFNVDQHNQHFTDTEWGYMFT